MAAKKIQASDVVVGNRTLEGVLADMAERMTANSDAIKANSDAIKALQEQNTMLLNEIRLLTTGLIASGARTDERLRKLEERAA